jgi:hypothetical protein
MAGGSKNECDGQEVKGQMKGVTIKNNLCLLLEVMNGFKVLEFTTT